MAVKPAPKVRARIAGNPEFLDTLVSGMKRIGPKKGGDSSVEVTRTNKSILSKVRYVLKTGIRSFDRITGCIPFGRVTEIFGLDSCGKTGLVMRAAIRAQMREIYEKIIDPDDPKKFIFQQIGDEADVTVVYIDNEQSIDDDGKTVVDGVALDCALARCDTLDDLFKQVDFVINKVIEHEAESKRLQFVVIIVDTIAGTSSKEEMTQEWGKEDYSRQPKQLRKAFRRMTRKINRRNVAMICTNQVSDRYQAAMSRNRSPLPQAQDFDTFGGRALKYYSTLRVFMYRVAKWSLVRKSKFPDGMLIGFYTEKNRMLKPFREGRMVLVFSNQGLEDEDDGEDGDRPVEGDPDFVRDKRLQGGYNDLYSMLETLGYLKFATTSKESGAISFRFDAWGVQTKTFEDQSTMIEDEPEVRPGHKRRNPTIDSRMEWPEFYRAHEIDFNAMWETAVKYVFSNEGLEGFVKTDDDDEDED